VARIILVTGGGRSGKSTHGQNLAESLEGTRVLVATAVPSDSELEERIRRHQEARQAGGWSTVEEPVDLASTIRACGGFPVILVDCLTMWVNNLLWGKDPRRADLFRSPDENDIDQRCSDILAACHAHRGTVIFITNEVGMGIIPDNPASRRFRDLLGRCNQRMAAGADSVILMVSGLPVVLKSSERNTNVSPG